MTRRSYWIAVVAAMVAAAGITAFGAMMVASGGGDAATSEAMTIPTDGDAIVAVLRTAREPRSPELVAALRAARAAPDDVEAARTAARLLIAEGRSEGDPQLVGAALGILRPVMEPPQAETLYLAATARQYQHDFTGALDLLDQAVALDPGHINALLTRATVKMVQGRLGEAQKDCVLVSELREDVGFLCQSTALIVSPQASRVSERLSQILAQPGLLPSSLEGWAIGLLGEIAMLQGDDAEARRHFEALLTRDPGALRERLLLADLLLRTDQAASVEPLLAEAPQTDGVLLRLARAARAQDLPDPVVEAALAERVQLNLDLGLDAHAREDTMYFLQIARNAAMALDRASANWALQHEVEDAQLLIDAAIAAGQPEAALPVLDWIAEEGVAVPALRIPEAVTAAAP